MLSNRAARRGRGVELLLAVGAALAAGAAGGYLIATRASSSAGGNTTEPPAARAERVTSLGRLQPAGGIVPLFGPPGDRIAKFEEFAPGVPIAPGQQLNKDLEVVTLASRKDRLLELQIAETQQDEANNSLKFAKLAGEQRVRAAQAELNQAKAVRSSDLAALDAKLAYLKLQTDTASANVARLVKLRADGVKIADEELDKSKLLAAQADAEQKATEASRKKTEITYDEGEKAAEAKVAAAQAELKEAEAKVPTKSAKEKLDLARQLADQTILKAPITGTVLKVTGREGQPTGTEPILQMADLSAMTAIAEVYESDVGRLAAWVEKGPVKAEVKNPALPRTLSGSVRSGQDISRMIARNQVFAMGPREDADRRVVEVVVHLDAASTVDASRFVGLQVTVTLEPGK
jgi:HlyD family secretion protein